MKKRLDDTMKKWGEIELSSIEKKILLIIIFFVVITLITAALFVFFQPEEKDTKNSTAIKIDLVQKKKELGPKWELIILKLGEEPFVFYPENGTGWRVMRGAVWVKADDKEPFLERPGDRFLISADKIILSPAFNQDAVIFYKK